MCVGASAFAASTLVPGTNQNQASSTMVGRSASLKITPGTNGTAVVSQGNSYNNQQRINILPLANMFVQKKPKISYKNASKQPQDIFGVNGKDGSMIEMKVNQNGELVWWLVDSQGVPQYGEQSLGGLDELFKNVSGDEIVPEIRCNEYYKMFEYVYGDKTSLIYGSRCAPNDGVAGDNGKIPVFDCQDNHFVYSVDGGVNWEVLQDSVCSGQDGRNAPLPQFRCYGDEKNEYAQYKVGNSGWQTLLGGEQLCNNNSYVRLTADLECNDGFLSVDGKATEITCKDTGVWQQRMSLWCNEDGKISINNLKTITTYDFGCDEVELACQKNTIIDVANGDKYLLSVADCDKNFVCNKDKNNWFLYGKDTGISCEKEAVPVEYYEYKCDTSLGVLANGGQIKCNGTTHVVCKDGIVWQIDGENIDSGVWKNTNVSCDVFEKQYAYCDWQDGYIIRGLHTSGKCGEPNILSCNDGLLYGKPYSASAQIGKDCTGLTCEKDNILYIDGKSTAIPCSSLYTAEKFACEDGEVINADGTKPGVKCSDDAPVFCGSDGIVFGGTPGSVHWPNVSCYALEKSFLCNWQNWESKTLFVDGNDTNIKCEDITTLDCNEKGEVIVNDKDVIQYKYGCKKDAFKCDGNYWTLDGYVTGIQCNQ